MSRAPARVLALRAAFQAVGTVAPGLAARWAETIFRTPPRPASRPTEETFLERGRRFTVQDGDRELAGWEWGAGPAVVLVHGWGSRAGRFGAMGQALVDCGFRAVAYDGPAHGRSTGRLASLPEFARALRRVTDAVGPVHGLVGHSLGGAAVVLALRDGVRAGRVVLIAAPADVRQFTTAFADQLRLTAATRATLRGNLERRLDARWADMHLPTIVSGLRLPALLVHDRQDTDVPFHDAEAIAEAWPGAHLVATDGLGHRAVLRNASVLGTVSRFLQDAVPE